MQPQSLFEALKAKYGLARKSGNWINIPCPTCDDHNRKKAKRYVPLNGQGSSNCFICGVKRDVMDLLEGESILVYSKEAPEPELEVLDAGEVVLPYHHAIPINKLKANHPAVKFLNKDHLYDLDTYANVHKIVYVPFEGGQVIHNGAKFITSAERLVFPVYFNEKLVGWQMRSIPGTFYGDLPDCVRYYHKFSKGSYLYNYDQAKKFQRVVVVEGVKKALKLPNAVATWGTGISRRQLKMIQEWDEIVMMLDSDEGNNTQERARGFTVGFVNGMKTAINIDLKKYGVSSPDDLPSDNLKVIIYKEWTRQ